MSANLENSAVATGLEKVSFHSNPKERKSQEYSNYCKIASVSHANKVMLKIHQAKLQQFVNQELPDVQAGFIKCRGIRDQIANICWIIENKREFQKNIYFFTLTMLKTLCGSQQTEKFLKKWEISDHLYLSPEKPVCGSRNNCQNLTVNN